MNKFISAGMCLLMLFGIALPTFADTPYTVDDMVTDTASYIYNTVSDPQVGSVGGEWAVLGLARSNAEIPDEYYQNYYGNVEEYVRGCNGVLHDKKYTEYSRVVVALTAIGKNPENVAGYNLLTPLGDYEKTIWQGINGPAWALIALDSGNYEMPRNPDAKVQATREMYIERILGYQLADGGWSLSGDGDSDPDITGMALQALSKYRDNERVAEAIDKALVCVSKKQTDDGGFTSGGMPNIESSVQIMVALCELGIPVDDSRFVKNGHTILDNIVMYYEKGNGFKHTHSSTGSDLMATEQAFYGLVALRRMNEGENSLYRMSDAVTLSQKSDVLIYGLENKNPDIKKMDVVSAGKTFADINGHIRRTAIEALSARNIINGKTADTFEPDSTMTRAEFAAIITRGLGLPLKGDAVFTDVTGNDWFFDYVNTAYSYGIIKGVSETEFNPNGTITREEAAVMVARAAKLCGMDTEMETFEARDILAGFLDYVKASDWAVTSLAFCYDEAILSDDAMEINPKEAVTRAEIAQMLYNMLSLSKLI